MNTVFALAALLMPFALLVFAVLSLMRQSEVTGDDSTEPCPYDAPTDPALTSGGGRS